MNKRLVYGALFLCGSLFFSGCSGKTQVNPNSSDYQVSKEEIDFEKKKDMNKKLLAQYESGKRQGYEKAKEEIKLLIPYLESLRASAELESHGGLCLPPLFLDKRNKQGVKLVIGKAHICDNFTIDNVMDAVKSGIPGLPEFKVNSDTDKSNSKLGSGFMPSSISIDGEKKKDYFIEKVEKVVKLDAKIKNTFTNRKIMRESNYAFSKVEAEQDYLLIEFKSELAKSKFCSSYKICK